ncbi:MAG: TetR/AcrR family transcriptional regulator C-terminal domain-containing protein [Solirubrobacteraceae bacterium]
MAATTSTRRTHRRLNRDLIVDTAIALIERDGADALSMRRLGAELGVEAMSLYHHVPNRAELLSAVSERMLAPLQAIEFDRGWREACRGFAHALRGIAVTHPATFGLVGMRPLNSPPVLRVVERLLAVLVADGFEPRDALAVYRAVASYARGYALAEAVGFTVDASDPHARDRLQALSPTEFPILSGRARELSSLDADSGFERGLDALLVSP